MDNKVTKKRINDHLEYDWYKYLIILVAGIFIFVFAFSQINRTRDHEDVRFFVSCYPSRTQNGFADRAKLDMGTQKYKNYYRSTFGDNILRDIDLETQDPLGKEYGTLLQTHGMVSSDVLVLGKRYLDAANGGGYVVLTDELLTGYLLPRDINADGTESGLDIDDLEYYTTQDENGEVRRTGIKVSGFRCMTGTASVFETDWRNVEEYKKKYADITDESKLPDDEFYLVINPNSVNIGGFGNKKSKKENCQALYLVNRFIEYYR